MNTQFARTLSGLAIAATFGASAWLGTAAAHADVDTVELTSIADIDTLPVCEMEDGSDAPSLPCIWGNEGNAWLTFADHSLLIVDDTVVPGRPGSGDHNVTDSELGA